MRTTKTFLAVASVTMLVSVAMPLSALANETSPYKKMEKNQAEGEQQNGQMMQQDQMVQNGQMTKQNGMKGLPPAGEAAPATGAPASDAN